MSVKLRLQRRGRKKAPFYHIVAADARAPRDGRFIEKLGTYNPLTVPATIVLNHERAFHWVMQGAEPTDTVRAILRFRGVNYRKHLQVGVNKGAVTQEDANKRYQEWLDAKDITIEARRTEAANATAARHKAIDGVKKVKVVEVVEEAVVETVTETVTEVVEGVDDEVANLVETTPDAPAE